jgi:ribonuclease HI
MLDSILRRTGDEDRRGRGSAFRLTPWGAHAIRRRLHFPASNNMAEYEALFCGLKIAIETGIKRLDVRGTRSL